VSQEKIFQARKDQSFPWFETSQEQQESLVNECHWEGRVLFTQPIVIEDTIDTPEFNNLLGQYAARIENYRENHASLVAHIDSHAAAFAAKAVADERKLLKAQIAHLTHERDLALRANRAAAPQQHAQAALSDEQIDTIAKPYAGLGGIENYRAFSRAILAVSQRPAAAPGRSRANGNDAPSVQVKAQDDGLMPCPFCGSPAEHYPDGEEEGYDVMCSSTTKDCRFNVFGSSTREEAEALWNRRAALASQASKGAGVPEGWQLVPKEPTLAMVDAYNGTPSGIGGSPAHALHVWESMLSAAPSPAQAQPVADAVAMLRYVLPHIPPRAIDVAKARKGPTEDAYINTQVRKFLEVQTSPAQGDALSQQAGMVPVPADKLTYGDCVRFGLDAAAIRALAAKPADDVKNNLVSAWNSITNISGLRAINSEADYEAMLTLGNRLAYEVRSNESHPLSEFFAVVMTLIGEWERDIDGQRSKP
jgi:hypothetical protein